MKISIFGTGYVGLVSGACLADFGHDVTCVDTDAGRIARLHGGDVPFFEPGLAELVERHVRSGRLQFTTDAERGLAGAGVVFLAVGTPQGSNGEADLSQIVSAVSSMAPYLNHGSVVATKSTVPVGTGAMIRALLARLAPAGDSVDIVSNPEFLREGSAIADFMRPDRIVIGTSSDRAAAVMRELYRPLYLIETPLVFTTVETAEMIKYASNAFLAVKISFINEIANLCDCTGADVHVVAKAMGLDKRIGSKFLHPGPGYGGSCFPKDTRALAALASRHGVTFDVVAAAISANARQRDVVMEKIARAAGSLEGASIALLGLAFKPNTSDIRESPACGLCDALLSAGAHVRAFDPAAMDEARQTFASADRLVLADDAYGAAETADVLVIATEWNEFRSLDLDRLRGVMRRPVIVDARNVLDPARAIASGFAYYGTGRGTSAAFIGTAAAPEAPAEAAHTS
jgi:UDPglucose 6-dehydrogenase